MKSEKSKPIIVQKYGGATLADPEKIKTVAQRIANLKKIDTDVVVVVSAMGQTTNQLIALAHQISPRPNLRELDMLLTVGERISMALLSMALFENQCEAISFTGSQAGILTGTSHVNAFIVDVKAHRIEEALSRGKVVVLAGFQGVSSLTKEITTLGRGGTDTSAVAVSVFLKAERCEILKDVPGVFTADPKIISTAKLLTKLTYDELLSMTFWGAKVLHYRSVELAKNNNISLFIGSSTGEANAGTVVLPSALPPASQQIPTIDANKNRNSNKNTKIAEGVGSNMFESSKLLAINSHNEVIKLVIKQADPLLAFNELNSFLKEQEIPEPQILHLEVREKETLILLTGPDEILTSLKELLKSQQEKIKVSFFEIDEEDFCSVTATCTGASAPHLMGVLIKKLKEEEVPIFHIFMGPMSISFIVHLKNKGRTIKTLAALID